MSASIFNDKSSEPDSERLYATLGQKAAFWNDFRNYIESRYGPLHDDWKYYNPKSGWLLKVLKKKRNLFFMIPLKGAFHITFVFGDKAVSAVQKSDLPQKIKEELQDARKYMEGRGLRVAVNNQDDVKIIKELVEIKINN